MGKVFDAAYAPSTLGSFLRSFTFGHVRQLDAVASRLLTSLAGRTPLLSGIDDPDELVLVDIDDTIVEVHGGAKQGAGFGYSGVRGLNALIATVTTTTDRYQHGFVGLSSMSCVGQPRSGPRLAL